jgi:hypothetical protein
MVKLSMMTGYLCHASYQHRSDGLLRHIHVLYVGINLCYLWRQFEIFVIADHTNIIRLVTLNWRFGVIVNELLRAVTVKYVDEVIQNMLYNVCAN